jgi:carboxymethylenebutenolidase
MTGSDIRLRNAGDGFEFGAYHVPAQGPRKGGLLLIQEVFGIDENMRAMSDLFAGQGFEVITPSLFDRTEPGFLAEHSEEGFKRAGPAMMAVDWTDTTGDMQAALDFLDGPRFVAGFCWGGAATWIAACRCTGLTAASSFYGRSIVDHLDETPKVPIIFHYGSKDPHIPADNIDQVRTAAPKGSGVYMYDAGHGFFSIGEGRRDEASLELAKRRTLAFFADPSKAPA